MSNQRAYSRKFEVNAKDNPAAEPMGRPKSAAYIAALSAEMIDIARANGLDTLAYLLDMARLEAANTADDGKDSLTPSVK
ncbi:MAG: hypothetical protein M3R18_02930 [Pseudomonadota bacterium]|nr:hypothetical protein [Pseudomonadota bacterium]